MLTDITLGQYYPDGSTGKDYMYHDFYHGDIYC